VDRNAAARLGPDLGAPADAGLNAREAKAGARICDGVVDLIGHTPLVRLHRLVPEGAAEVLVKLEAFTPGGSIKDRIAAAMIRHAEQAGLLKPGAILIEPTSGNTGIGLAAVCAAKGYRCLIVMPDSMSLERIAVLKRLGAEVVLTPAKDGLAGAMRKAHALAKANPCAFVPSQFDNAANPQVHRDTTAQEILWATGRRLDAFVAGVGTGGTITGVGQVLKAELAQVKVVAVEPRSSPVLSGGRPGHHKIQGIGAGFVPAVLDRSVIDEVRTVADDEAFETMSLLASQEGILAGMSSGAAVRVALELARELGAGRRVVAILPDTGERYLSVAQYFEL
jgi:cysteine synthase